MKNNYDWNLGKIYEGYSSKEYAQDLKQLEEYIKEASSFDFSTRNNVNVFKNAFKLFEKTYSLLRNLWSYSSLRLSANQNDIDALKQIGLLNSFDEELSSFTVKFNKYPQGYESFLNDCLNDEYLKNYEYQLTKMQSDVKHLLNDETEIMLSKLNKSGGSAWERMFDTLTSTLEVDYNGKIITLSEVRNLAYSSDQDERRMAYFAELNSYKKIEKTIAQALSSIKQQVTTVSESRGYASPLDQTLESSGMTRKTLEALIESIEDYLPIFRSYLKKKAEYLGYKNGLPFFELFAPVGKLDKEYTVEDAKEYLVSNFSTFNKEISSMMEKAFDNEWIDFFPKKGKVGGAFCSDAYNQKQSFILTNFDGSFGSIVTLAHELGHAFHNEQLFSESLLNIDVPMQLAETASTFNETFIKDNAIKNAKSNDEKLFVLESSIADDTQVIVDILSRYYFESSVFEKSKLSALTPEELCDLMLDAQSRSYGDGLDKEYMHKYMWCCKGHYYSTGLSFYNFPYAFGQLFAYGLYQIYKEKGEEFFKLYKDILKNAGKMPIRECVLKAGIDVESKEFWTKSLDLIKDKIEQFISLTK